MLNVKKWMMKVLGYLTTNTATPTFNSGFSGTIHSTTQVRKSGDLVTAYMRLQPITIAAGNNQSVVNIPSGFRPASVVYGTAYYNDNDAKACSINSSGNVALNISSAITNGYIICYFTYRVG